MDEKIWDYIKGTGTVGSVLIGLVYGLHKLGILKNWQTAVSSRTGSDEAVSSIVKIQKEKIHELNEEIAKVKADKEKDEKELKDKIKGLEAQYDLVASQFREAERMLTMDEKQLLEFNTRLRSDNRELRQTVMDTQTELAETKAELVRAKTEIEILKAKLESKITIDKSNETSDYTPVSGD